MATIKCGDVLTYKPERSDPGDENVIFRAVEDEDGGRVRVVADLGLGPLNPTHVARVDWIATVNGKEVR